MGEYQGYLVTTTGNEGWRRGVLFVKNREFVALASHLSRWSFAPGIEFLGTEAIYLTVKCGMTMIVLWQNVVPHSGMILLSGDQKPKNYASLGSVQGNG